MLNDPRDPGAYRIAIAALGLAVAIALAGICWIAAVHVASGKVEIHKTIAHVDKEDPVHEDRVTFEVKEEPARLEMGRVPVELWLALGALGGVFVGALIPSSLREAEPDVACMPTGHPCKSNEDTCKASCSRSHGVTWRSFGVGPRLLVLLIAVIVLVCLLLAELKHTFDAVAVTTVGLLLGLLIPSPGRRDR